MPGFVDVEEADAPAFDVIERASGSGSPRLWWRGRRRVVRILRRGRNAGARHLNILWCIALQWYRLIVTDREFRSASHRHLSCRDVAHEDDSACPSRTRFDPVPPEILTRSWAAARRGPGTPARISPLAHRVRSGSRAAHSDAKPRLRSDSGAHAWRSRHRLPHLQLS